MIIASAYTIKPNIPLELLMEDRAANKKIKKYIITRRQTISSLWPPSSLLESHNAF